VGLAPEAPLRWTPADVISSIGPAAAAHDISSAQLRCLSWYESKHDPYAVSATGDHGHMQFHVYRDGSSLMSGTPWAGESVYDPEAASNAAAWLIKRGYLRHWATAHLCR